MFSIKGAENIVKYVEHVFELKENKKSVVTSNNIKKILKLNDHWDDQMEYASIVQEFKTIIQSHPNLFTCIININEKEFTLDVIKKLLDTKGFDSLMYYVIYLDNVELIQKLIPKDDLYVKLKYHYYINDASVNIINFLKNIEKERQDEKLMIYKLLKNTDDHIDALNDGILKENYNRLENVFGMTPDDNIVAKMLLLFNKVFNKGEKLNEKDISTLKNMRKSILNIRRNNEHNVVESQYFYSIDLHNLFFAKTAEQNDMQQHKQTKSAKLNKDCSNSGSDSESNEVSENDVPLLRPTKMTKPMHLKSKSGSVSGSDYDSNYESNEVSENDVPLSRPTKMTKPMYLKSKSDYYDVCENDVPRKEIPLSRPTKITKPMHLKSKSDYHDVCEIDFPRKEIPTKSTNIKAKKAK